MRNRVEYSKNYYQLNKTRIDNLNKKYYILHKTETTLYKHKYYLKNRIKYLKNSKLYRKKNLKKYLKYEKWYRKNNVLKIAKLCRVWRQKNYYSNHKRCECGKEIRNDSKNCKVCNVNLKNRVKILSYKNIKLRGTWELNYAKYLDENKIKWLYQYKTFKFKNYNYTPDFYLPNSDTYVEIKGYWYANSKLKYKNFKRRYRNIELLNKRRLKKLGVIL